MKYIEIIETFITFYFSVRKYYENAKAYIRKFFKYLTNKTNVMKLYNNNSFFQFVLMKIKDI